MQSPEIELLVIGASGRAAVQSARKAGIQAFAIDLFADVDTRHWGEPIPRSDYPSAFAERLMTLNPKYWMFTGGLEGYPNLLEELQRYGTYLGTSIRSIRTSRSAIELDKLVRSLGFPSAWIGLSRNHLVNETSVAKIRQPEALPTTILKKQLSSSGGMGVERVPVSELEPSDSSCWQYEVVGETLSAGFVAHNDRIQKLGVTKLLCGIRALNAPEFCYCGSIGPLADKQLRPGLSQSIDRLAEEVRSRFKIRGLFGIDFIDDGSQLFLLEINPRYTASMELFERNSPDSIIAAHVIALKQDSSLVLQQRRRSSPRHANSSQTATSESDSIGISGKAIVYQEPGRAITIAAEFVEACLKANSEQSAPAVADIPKAGTRIGPGEPVMTVFHDQQVSPQHLPLELKQFEQELYSAASDWAKLAERTS